MRAGSNARALARFLLRASTSPLPPPPPPRARPPALPNARVLGARASSSSSSSWDALPLPKTTRALTYDAHGSPTRALTLARDLPLPPLGARGALVRWLAAPVNPADLNVVEGVYPLRPASFPAVGGNEGVGVVVRLGADAGDVVVECDAGDTDAGGDGDGDRALRVGDVVVPAAPGPGGVGGTWREWAVVDASRLRVAPSDLPLAETAQMSVNPPTAFRMLHDFVPMPRLRDDDDDDANLHAVALNAPTSAVGRAAIQLCAMYGVLSVALLRPRAAETEYDADARELKRLGASVVIRDDGAAHRDRETRELLASLPPIKLALNGVGGASSRSLASLLAPRGVVVTYGGMGRKPVEIPVGKSIFEDIEHRGFWLTRWLRDEEAARRRAWRGGEEAGGGGGGGGGEIAAGPRAGERAAMASELYDAARAGALRMPAVEVDIEEVLDAMRARPSVGARKLVIRMPWKEWEE